jgi:hypothetical protein
VLYYSYNEDGDAAVAPPSSGRKQYHGQCPERRTAMYEKEIVYDPETRDFAMYLDGELVGFARTYQEAEVTLDQLVFELINGQYFREAA